MSTLFESFYDEADPSHIRPVHDETVMAALSRARGLPTLRHQRESLRDDLVAMLSVAVFGDAVANAPHVVMRSGSAPMHLARVSLAEQVAWYCRRLGVQDNLSEKGILRAALTAPLRAKAIDKTGSTAGYIALSMSRTDVPSVVADALGKSIAYLASKVTPTCEPWTKTVLCDRLSGKAVSIHATGSLDEVDEGDEAEDVFTSDTGENFAIKQRANVLTISRHTLVDDDLAAFDPLRSFVGAEAMTLDKLAYGILTANANTADGSAFFSTAHANLTTGTVTTANIGAALAKLAAQENARGEPMGLRAGYLITPLAQAMVANDFILRQVDPVAMGSYAPLVRMVAASELDATSAIQWYLVMSPEQAPAVLIARPRDYPDAELTARIRFSDDALQFKCSLWASAAAGSWRAAVRSSGS